MKLRIRSHVTVRPLRAKKMSDSSDGRSSDEAEGAGGEGSAAGSGVSSWEDEADSGMEA